MVAGVAQQVERLGLKPWEVAGSTPAPGTINIFARTRFAPSMKRASGRRAFASAMKVKG